MSAVPQTYQAPVEFISDSDAQIRVPQSPVEFIEDATGAARIAQNPNEFIADIDAKLRVAQMCVEFIWIPIIDDDERWQRVPFPFLTAPPPRVFMDDDVFAHPPRAPRERPEFGHARRIRDVERGAGHRWIDNPGRRA